jgi:dihydrofolate synthase / folylpolyglutamate synthase
MIVNAIKTKIVTPKCCTVFELLDEYIGELTEGSVVVVTSKIVSLCEGSVVPLAGTDKDELIKQNCEYYLPKPEGRYDVGFTIARGRLSASAGIDESNTGEFYALLPRDPQQSANEIRAHLRQKHGVKNLGVIITDSTSRPLRWGTTAVSIACSGFEVLEDYIGKLDLFGRKFEYHKNNMADCLASAAVVGMGEGAEQKPLAIIQGVPSVKFRDKDLTAEELADLIISPEDDIYAPFLKNAPWQKGDLA